MAIDSTNTLGKEGHNRAKTWANDLINLFTIGTQLESSSSRVEVIQFWGASASKRNPQSHAVVDIDLNGGYANKIDLQNKITNLPFHAGGTTLIPHGLALLNREIPNSPPRKTYVLVLTDGIDDTTSSNIGKIDNPPAGFLKDEARELKRKNNVTVLAIGFTDSIDEGNLREIASSEDFFIRNQNLGVALNKTYNKLVETLCPNIPTRSTPPGEFNPLSLNVTDLGLIGVLFSVGK